MAKSEQLLKKIKIHMLKNLQDVEIDLCKKPLIAILGPNGSGKSTILHALSCVNNPVFVPYQTVNHKLSEFFTPTTHSIWTGSSFDIYQSFRDGQNVTNNHLSRFRKQRERWSPRYSTRIERYVSFVGIRTCVPKIELETQQGRIQYNTILLNDRVSNKVKEIAGIVMNRNYTEYNEHKAGGNKQYIGVLSNGINYSSLSMGAGEQRIFYILTEVIKAPNHGLILIDEIDLLLHQEALFRLMTQINIIAVEKKLQIIFTTHAQSLIALDFIEFRHLYQTPNKTLCFNQTKPDTLQRLTGIQIRPLEVFVEDDLARVLVKKICAEEKMTKYVSIKEFGAAINCFTSVCGSILNNIANLENMLFIIDGDLYRSTEEKQERIKKILTGNTVEHENLRQLALEKITQFTIPNFVKPEQYYHRIICGIPHENLQQEQIEILEVAKQIGNPGDSHKYFDDIIERMDYDREVGLNKLIDLLSLTNEWDNIKENIKNWLETKKEGIIE